MACLLALLSLPLGSALAAPAVSLTVGEGLVNPLGCSQAAPRFSWKLPIGVRRQTAYRIQTTTSDGLTWDSGWIESDQSTFVRYAGPALHSRAIVTWRVNFRDDTGAEAGWSESATCELGLLAAADWSARWIRPAAELPADAEPVACLRRAFSINKPVARARLYATARGVFEFELNGRRVGSDHFANGFTSYKKRIDTLAYDVTAQLQPGENSLRGLLGTGWYAGRFPFGTRDLGPYGRDIALLAQLEITYTDGTREIIASDNQWQATFDGPVVASSLYDGESYDARRQPAHWQPVLVEPDLGNAILAPKPFPPVRAARTLVPRGITQPRPGRYVFDLGQNMAGWARLRIPVERDGTVTVRYAEMLQADGTLYTEAYRTAKSTETYTAAQTGVVTWEPHFTYHGFRYVELSGLPAGAVPETDWVTGVVLHSDLPTTGWFASSDATLNQLQSNLTWGWRGNSLDYPTDCPQRDERMGWTGDAQVFCATSLFNTGAHAFWKAWLRSLRDDQYPDGALPAFAPTAQSKWETRSPGWMDAGTIIPWDVYVRTGDTELLAENYPMMERQIAWYRSQSVGGLLPGIRGFGDWLQPYPQARPTEQDRDADRRGDTPLPLIGAAFYARSTQILADSARVLGRTADAERYDAEAAAVRAAFAAEYFDPEGRLKHTPETQTGYVLALAFELLPESLRGRAGDHLARLVGEAGGHLRTGFLGTPFLALALDRTGHAALAADLLFQESYPSWFFSIDQGATTIWERWNSYTRAEGFGDVSMNSFNHYAYGAIGQWLYERVAGLAPDPRHPGYKHFVVRPLVVRQLTWAAAAHETPYGTASSRWEKAGNKLILDIVVPPNTTATIEFPEGRAPETVAAGAHHYEIARAASASPAP
ncbi:MAG: family 78 glycoside hydrolase catalytic domain [Opitutaceae bacterium]